MPVLVQSGKKLTILHMRVNPLITVITFLLLPGLCSAQFRKYSNEFLNIGAGARGLGMGAAQVASVSDGTAGYWNPAALTGVQDVPSISLMHASYFDNIGKYDLVPFRKNTSLESQIFC